ncbi:unnamed protein product, partial [Rotaria socialis]
YTSIAPNLISLDLLISGSPNTVSVYSILPILRVYHRIRYLHAIIKHEIPSENNNFFHESPEVVWPSSYDLVNGYTWQYMFEMHVPFLSKFDFHISILKEHPKLDLDVVVNSFQYFVQKYPEWQMIIDRWG